jgi:hypothetical protein
MRTRLPQIEPTLDGTGPETARGLVVTGCVPLNVILADTGVKSR